MKFYFTFLFALLFNIVCLAEVKIEYRISKMHGLFNFVFAVADQPNIAPGLKEVFVRSQFNTAENQKLISDFKTLESSLQNGYNFSKPAPQRAGGPQVQDTILIQSFFAKDLNDLSQRILGLMPIEDQIKFFAILKKFEPIYDKLVWNESLPNLKRHKIKLQQLAKKIDLQKMFTSAQIFYRSNWPKDIPFTIGLYPIPFLKNFRNSTTSQSLGNIEEHGVLSLKNDNDLNSSFGVIFHELCHSLYASQSDDFKKEFYNYFKNSKTPEGLQTYDWVNEALATAIGNGWAYELATKKLDEKSWYNQTTIDTLGKEIFTEVKSYLAQQKPIDKDFVEHVISIYAKKFPNALYIYDRILSKVFLTHNQSITDRSKVKSLLTQNLNLISLFNSSPLAHPQSILSLSQTDETVMAIFSEKEFAEFEKLAITNNFLKENLKTFSKMKNKTFFASLDEKRRAFIIIKAENNDEIALAVKKMFELKQIDPKNSVQNY